MANSRYGFICCEKFLYDFNYSGGQSQIFGRTATCDEQAFVISYIYGIKIGCQSEIVTSFFGICLFAFKVMNCCTDHIACFFIGTDSINLIAQHFHCLERYHCFIIFCKVAC